MMEKLKSALYLTILVLVALILRQYWLTMPSQPRPDQAQIVPPHPEPPQNPDPKLVVQPTAAAQPQNLPQAHPNIGDPNGVPPPSPGGPGAGLPSILSRVEPQYSEEARQAGVRGTVVLATIVRKDGTVDVLRVGPKPRFRT